MTQVQETQPTTSSAAVVRRVVQRGFVKRLGYLLFQWWCRMMFLSFYRIRCFGREHLPESGAGLVCSNHQSHLDPMLQGVLPNRPMNYLARRTLFNIKWLAPAISFLDAIPIERGGMGIAGVKETLRRLKRGELVSMYPEGTRTSDGKIAEFKPGFIAIARRAKVPIIPVGLDGAFDAWPRTWRLPKPGQITVFCEKMIPYEEYESMSDEDLIIELEIRIRSCFEKAKAFRKRMHSF